MSASRLSPAVLVSLLAALAVGLVAFAADLGVINGGFEDAYTDSTRPPGWSHRSGTIDAHVQNVISRSGNQSLWFNGSALSEYYQALDVSLYAGQSITTSGWMYTYSETSGGIQAAIADSATCDVSSGDRTTIGDAAEKLAPGNWQQFQGSIPVPTTASEPYLCIFLWADAPDLYMDDINATSADPTRVGLSHLSAVHTGTQVTILALAAVLVSGATAAIKAWHAGFQDTEVRGS